jgi:hypothetical protein
LEDWVASKWLVKHRTSRSEIGSLLDLAERDLKDAQVAALSPDWRHNIAYNAILQLAQAALAAAGYRASREQHHRNRAEYDAAGLISEAEAEEVYVAARDLRLLVEEWLRKRFPDLM